MYEIGGEYIPTNRLFALQGYHPASFGSHEKLSILRAHRQLRSKAHLFFKRMDYGSDISAMLWKKYQHVQIQKQLDLSHAIDLGGEEGGLSGSDEEVDSPDMKTLKRLNIDNYFAVKKKRREGVKGGQSMKAPEKFSRDIHKKSSDMKKYILYNYIFEIYKKSIDDFNQCEALEDIKPLIQRNIHQYLITNNFMTYPKSERLFQDDVHNIFSFVAHFIDNRKIKLFVRYMLSDGLERYGIVLGHPVFPGLPMWIFDACRLVAENPKLYLLYSTDTRNVSKWFGHLVSLTNMSNLLYLKIERDNPEINTTLIFLHLVGIFTHNMNDPINRQGMKYQGNILQRTTFENVKNQLSKMAKSRADFDTLNNFISSTTMCVPRPTGTNSFGIVINP